MNFEVPGKLEKIKIIALDGGSKQLRPNGAMIVMVNPKTFSEHYTWKYTDNQASGTTGAVAKFVKQLPKTFDLPLLFDGTGVMEPTVLPFEIGNQLDTISDLIPSNINLDAGSLISVDLQIKLFLKVTGRYDGEEHQVKRLLITWGPRADVCYLTELDLKYTLFSPEGMALRAEGTATFRRTEDPVVDIAKNMISSPDLSHQRVVKAGDNLMLLCEEIYGDPTLNQSVARYNGLASFRQLKPGMTLDFPPLNQGQ